MAADTVTVWEAALKQGWTQESLEKQFYSEDPLLDAIEVMKPTTTIGLEALTPIWTGRGGGYSVAPTNSGSAELNSADPQNINRAKWTYKRHYKQIEIDTGIIQQSTGSANAVANVVDTEIEGALSDMRKQITRQLFTDQTALIAQCAVTSASTEVKLLNTGLGYQAIRNGWLVEGQEVDIGSKSNQKLRLAKKPIVSVKESETEPALVFGEAVTTAETDYVSIANARSGETSYENNGFRNLISPTTTVGGLAPATVAGWAATEEKVKNVITRQAVLGLQRKIRQKGVMPDWAFTSLKQVEALENQAYPQVRFADPKEVNSGDGMTFVVGTIKVQGHNDCPDSDFNLLKKDHIAALRTDKPAWIPEKYGGTKILQWRQNTTFLVSALEYFFELITNRRNALGALRELS